MKYIIKGFYLYLYTGKSNSHAKPKQQAISHINSFFNGRFILENFCLQKSSNSSYLCTSVTELSTDTLCALVGNHALYAHLSQLYASPVFFKRWIALPMHQINHYQHISISETNCAFQWIDIYPVDSVIQLLNNWGLICRLS